VQLVPTTSSNPPAYYTVRYNSDGRVQFEETWAVPSSAAALRVRDVRVSTGEYTDGNPSGGGPGTIEGPIAETDVVGLIADLSARPLKGPGFAAGRVAVVNALGALESAVGSATDCVRVDGSSGPCGTPAPSFVDGDSPSGIVDGANTTFSLAAVPDPMSSLAVYRNGILQKSGSDYTITGRTVQFAAASVPQPGDTLLAAYRLGGGAAAGASQVYASPQVLCSGVGAVVNGAEFGSIGTCAIPAGMLIPGDRIEIRFDLEHAGASSGFTFDVQWGGTTILRRDASAAESQVSGRADAALVSNGAKLSHQSWGGVLPFAAGVANAPDAWASGIVIGFRGKMASAGETLGLRGYTVTRLP
jgi:hypothetical protein